MDGSATIRRRGGAAMLGRCYRCAEELTAADGPNLLGSPDGAGTPRYAFHLRCWLRLQAELMSKSAPFERRAARQAA
jgi:hypothetical protein